MRAALLLLLVVVVAVAAQQATLSPAVKKRVDASLAASGKIDLKNLNKIQGKWYEHARSLPIFKTFMKGCVCSFLDIKLLEKNKFYLVSSCKNATTGKYVSVNASMTQVNVKQPGAFRVDFLEKNTTAIPAAAINKTAKAEVKKKIAGKDLNEEEEEEGQVKAAAGGSLSKEANTYVIYLDESHMVLAAPQLDGIWILGKKQKADEAKLQKLIDFATQQGFTTKSIEKVKQENC